MPRQKNYLLVDGYNIIHAWDELAKLAVDNMPIARQRLCDILCDYQGIVNQVVIVVFDAHLVEGGLGSLEEYHNITVVYTKEAETADHYIEQAAWKLSKNDQVTVATSDRIEQIIIISHGAQRMSAGDLKNAVQSAKEELNERFLSSPPAKSNPLFALLDADTARKLDAMRYDKKRKKRKN